MRGWVDVPRVGRPVMYLFNHLFYTPLPVEPFSTITPLRVDRIIDFVPLPGLPDAGDSSIAHYCVHLFVFLRICEGVGLAKVRRDKLSINLGETEFRASNKTSLGCISCLYVTYMRLLLRSWTC